MYTTLISVNELAAKLDDDNWVIVDCSFALGDTEAGRAHYEAHHIPGAVYAHLDEDLSGPPVTDAGRHPLPTPEAMRATFGRWGIGPQTQVVAYDNRNGVYAARLWWMLRYMGHEAVAVLDGGWAAWETAVLPAASGSESNSFVTFVGEPRCDWLVQVAEVPNATLLVDSRAAPRYRGEVEPLDKQAGHIPGAKKFDFSQHWENGRYKTAAAMKAQLEALLGNMAADETTFYCGSGVSACVNLLALHHAGLGNGRLYVGSWSEWSSDLARPMATGEE